MDIRKMYGYHVWANDTLLQHLRTLPEEILHCETQSSFPTIAMTLRHMWGCDAIWLFRIMGETDSRSRVHTEWPEAEINLATIDTIEDKYNKMRHRYDQFFTENRDLDVPTKLEPDEPPISSRDVIHHVINHGTYHRGNIATMLRQLGYSSVLTDYEIYVCSSSEMLTGLLTELLTTPA